MTFNGAQMRQEAPDPLPRTRLFPGPEMVPGEATPSWRGKTQPSSLSKVIWVCVSKLIIINVSGVNTHLLAILMFTRAIRF